MEKKGERGCILYDGSCGACTYFIGERAPFFEKHGFKVAAIQEPWVQELFPGNPEHLMKEIHLLAPDGRIVRGADVYREVWNQIWWLRPLNWLSRVPLISNFVDYLYAAIAKRRRKISDACGLESKARFK